MTDTLTLYKLIILKMLSMIDAPLTNSQISEFILEKEYTNYFTLQQALSELDETGLVTISNTHNSSSYHITEAGNETLRYFGDKISDAICQDIQEYLGQKQHEIQDTLSVTANYFLGNTEDYLVCCQVREKNATLINLTISVPSEKQAISVCNHWKSKSQEIYAHVMEQLL